MKKLGCILVGLAALSVVVWAMKSLTVTVTCTPGRTGFKVERRDPS